MYILLVVELCCHCQRNTQSGNTHFRSNLLYVQSVTINPSVSLSFCINYTSIWATFAIINSATRWGKDQDLLVSDAHGLEL